MIRKAIGLKRAVDLMRLPGTRMVRMFTIGSPEGHAHYIVPGGYIEPETAEKIKARFDVIAGEDGLFPNLDQTWRIMREEMPGQSAVEQPKPGDD